MVRAFARWLLGWVVRLTPEESRDWALAMLEELEYVEGDWEALWWAFGSMVAIAQLVERGCLHSCAVYAEKWREQVMEHMGKKAGLLAVGAVGTVVLMASVLGFQALGTMLFPGFQIPQGMMHVVTVILIPGLICGAIGIWIWRKFKPLALGIFLSLAFFGAHIAVHLVHHMGRH